MDLGKKLALNRNKTVWRGDIGEERLKGWINKQKTK